MKNLDRSQVTLIAISSFCFGFGLLVLTLNLVFHINQIPHKSPVLLEPSLFNRLIAASVVVFPLASILYTILYKSLKVLWGYRYVRVLNALFLGIAAFLSIRQIPVLSIATNSASIEIPFWILLYFPVFLAQLWIFLWYWRWERPKAAKVT